MRSFLPMSVLAIGSLLFLSQAVNAATSSGLDTVNGNQIFAVEGTKVGEWGPGELNVTGGVVASGSVQVGQTTTTCTSGNEGAFRYRKTSNQMEFCNGTAWTVISGGATGSWCGAYSVFGDINPLNGIMTSHSYRVISGCPGDSVTSNGFGAISSITCPSTHSLVTHSASSVDYKTVGENDSWTQTRYMTCMNK